MNKLFKSIVAASVGVAMAIGVGAGLGKEVKAAYAAGISNDYTLLTTSNLSSLSTSDKVVVVATIDGNATGVTGFSGSDATISTDSANWKKFSVTNVDTANNKYSLKDPSTNNWISLNASNKFSISATSQTNLNADASGYFTYTDSNNDARYLAKNGTYYRCYKGNTNSSYVYFYVYIAPAGGVDPTPEDVTNVDAESTPKTVEEIRAYQTADNTLIAKVTGVAEYKYGDAQYGNFHLVNPSTGKEITIYGGYTDTTFTKLNGVYSIVKGSNAVTDSIVGKNVTAYSTIAVHSSVGQLANALVVIGSNYDGNVDASVAVNDDEMGSATISNSTTAYGSELVVTPNPADGYTVKTVEVTRASRVQTLEAEQDGTYKFNAEIKNEVLVTFEIAGEIPEPTIETRTIEQFISGENVQTKAYYVTGTVKAFKSGSTKDKYGNMTLTDGTNDLIIYGATMNDDALVWNKNIYVYTNPQNFITNAESNALVLGSVITMKLIRCDYGTKIEGQGVITQIHTIVKLNTTSLEVEEGDTATITATILPASASGTITWSSSDTSVATVDGGVVTGVAAGEAVISATIGDYTANCSVTVTAAPVIPEGQTIVSKQISQISGTTSDGHQVLKMNLDSVICASTNSGTNNGKVYDSGKEWRLYQSDNGVVTISATEGYLIISVTFTYTAQDSGRLMYGEDVVSSGTAVEIDSLSSVAFTVSKSGSGTNGKVKVSAISVTYVVDETITPAQMIESQQTYAKLSYNYLGNSPVIDKLNKSASGVASNNYTNWDENGVVLSSGVSYTGRSAGANNSIQLKDSDNSGIITLSNPNANSYVRKVTIKWNTSTLNNRTIAFFGKNSAYTALTDLYSDETKGEPLGELTYLEGGNIVMELTVSGNYSYIGIKSASGAFYIDSIAIQWGGDASYEYDDVAIRLGGSVSKELWNGLSEIQGYGVMLSTKTYVNNNGGSLKNLTPNDSDVKDFYMPLSTKYPVDGGNNYYWNLYKNVTSTLSTEYVAVAYIKTSSKTIFLQQVTASAKSLAYGMIVDNVYELDAFEGSLSGLACK